MNAPQVSDLTTRPISGARWATAGLLALIAAGAGLLVPDAYTGLIPPATLPGALAQDVVSALAAVALIGFSVLRRSVGTRGRLVALGLLGYLSSAFGIYAIERVYNEFYLLYLAVFAVSCWAAVAEAIGVVAQVGRSASLPRTPRLLSAAGSLLQPLIFVPLWISILIPLMASRTKIDSLYSVFILDLCFVMPAFAALGVLTFRRRPVGLVLAPAMFVLGATLIGSLALSEAVKPAFEHVEDAGGIVIDSAFTVLFVGLAVLHLRALGTAPERAAGDPRPRSGRSSTDLEPSPSRS